MKHLFCCIVLFIWIFFPGISIAQSTDIKLSKPDLTSGKPLMAVLNERSFSP